MRHVCLCCLMLAVLPLARPAVSLADGGGNDNSAGDNQYVDPLANTAPAPKAKPKPKPAPSTTSTSPSTTTSSSTTSSSTTSSTATASKAASAHSSRSGTLPRTGLPVALVAAAGLALLAAGLALRRAVRDP